MLDRQLLVDCAPHQRSFVVFDSQQVAHYLGFALSPRFMREGWCGIVCLGGDLGIKPLDQLIFE